MHDILLEIGCEELPTAAVRQLGEDLFALLAERLKQQGVTPESGQWFATPRRLACTFFSVPESQPPQLIEKRGPAISAAFTADGQPTTAALRFAESCGARIADLSEEKTEKGQWLFYRSTVPGQSLQQLLPGLLTAVLNDLIKTLPKAMRWGEGQYRFARPVQWLVLLVDDQVLPWQAFGLQSNNLSYGHRSLSAGEIHLHSAARYQADLAEAFVIADFAERKAIITKEAQAQAQTLGADLVLPEDLLEELASLTEYPVALLGEFEERFLAVPPEVLILTMQTHQKYIALLSQGKLLKHFVIIANVLSKQPEVIRQGNEKVIRPRFSDAEFFFKEDRKITLEDRLPRLTQILFHQKLGSIGDKIARVEGLLSELSTRLQSALPADFSLAAAHTAAKLCKADLTTQLVQEFPELQGTIGGYYAALQGETAGVAQAIREHYQPRFAKDALPSSALGKMLALADKTDSLVGLFLAGEKPSGSKDPYALRRAALGLLRLLDEGQLHIALPELLRLSANQFKNLEKDVTILAEIENFIWERLRATLQEQGIPLLVFDAVKAVSPVYVHDFNARVQALNDFRHWPEAESLAAANKRLRNLLKTTPASKAFNQQQLQESAERDLAEALAAFAVGDNYQTTLKNLAALKPAIDAFFDRVLVLCEDEDVRANRLALLQKLRAAFLTVADVSLLAGLAE
jgi:glycyl-tRNA synthetase beta chain